MKKRLIILFPLIFGLLVSCSNRQESDALFELNSKLIESEMDKLMQQYLLNPAKSGMYARKGRFLKELFDSIQTDFIKSGKIDNLQLQNLIDFIDENGSIFLVHSQLDLSAISEMDNYDAMTYLQTLCLFELQSFNDLIYGKEFAYNNVSVETISEGDSIRLIIVPSDTTYRPPIRVREHLDNSTRFNSQFGNARYFGRDAYVKKDRLKNTDKISGDIIIMTINGDLDTIYFESIITAGNTQ